MERRALAMGAAVLAAVPIVSCETIPAIAEDAPILPSWEQWWSLVQYNVDDPTISALYDDPTAGSWWKLYVSAVSAIVEGVYINGNYEITPDSYSSVSGYYLRNGVRRFGSMYGDGVYRTVTASKEGATMDPITLVTTQDGQLVFYLSPTYLAQDTFDIRKMISPAGLDLSIRRNSSGDVVASLWFDGSGMFDDFSQSVRKGHYQNRYIRAADVDPVEFTTTSDYISTTSSGGRILLGSAATVSSLPTASGYETITADNALDYVTDILNPYIVDNAPSVEPYLYDPNATPTPAPTYPVQETWAQEADWPEGNLLPTIPAASYSVDIPEIMTEGVSFWWRCLGVLFDGLGITAVVVGLLALGIVLYFVLR